MLFRLFPVFLMVVAVSFFMHTGVQMKCVSKLTDARRTSRGRWLFPTRLWDFIRERKKYHVSLVRIWLSNCWRKALEALERT